MDTYVSSENVRRMKSYQRINHFPFSYELGKKNNLCTNLTKMKKIMHKDFQFFPASWNFPADIDEFKK
jgi:tubulin polyglutamylase TTLL6/13